MVAITTRPGFTVTTAGDFESVPCPDGIPGCGVVHLRRRDSLPASPPVTPPFTLACCPVCRGRGNVPAAFCSPGLGTVGTAADVCQACAGRGLLKVYPDGTVEKVT